MSGAGDEAMFCGQCGLTLAEPRHEGCALRATLEPPRYCTFCGRRMIVQVTPTGWWARCSRHGDLTSAGSATSDLELDDEALG